MYKQANKWGFCCLAIALWHAHVINEALFCNLWHHCGTAEIHWPGSKLYELWPIIVATRKEYVIMQDGWNNKDCFGLLPHSSSSCRWVSVGYLLLKRAIFFTGGPVLSRDLDVYHNSYIGETLQLYPAMHGQGSLFLSQVPPQPCTQAPPQPGYEGISPCVVLFEASSVYIYWLYFSMNFTFVSIAVVVSITKYWFVGVVLQ